MQGVSFVYTVFIDGREGTTGLRIFDRLSPRSDIELIVLPEEERKNPQRRKEALNQADAAFLCLPDAAAREAVSMVENPKTVLLDTSTAHRTHPDWAYGFPELSEEHTQKILSSKRIAVPGCHASGFIALIYPLIAAGILSYEALLCCHSLTGYSGGGKKMIAQYQACADSSLDAPRPYGWTQAHKHLPEMTQIPGLAHAPAFLPVVGNFYSGMLVSVPLHRAQLLNGASIDEVRSALSAAYTGEIVSYRESLLENGFLSAGALSGSDAMLVSVEGNAERMQLLALYDNLGKGASGAAVQVLNMIMGVDATTGLQL